MDEAKSISLKLKSIMEKLRQAGDAAFAEYGLTGPQVGYMAFILKSGGTISQRDLEKEAGVSHPTIVGVVSRLRDKGYVEVATDEKDRRKRVITLTEKARNVTGQLIEGGKAMDDCLLKGLTEDDKKELNRLLGIIELNLA